MKVSMVMDDTGGVGSKSKTLGWAFCRQSGCATLARIYSGLVLTR